MEEIRIEISIGNRVMVDTTEPTDCYEYLPAMKKGIAISGYVSVDEPAVEQQIIRSVTMAWRRMLKLKQKMEQ